MRSFRITVEGTAYDVTVEEMDAPAGATPAPKPEMKTPVAASPAVGTPPPAAPIPSAAPAVAAQPGDVTSPMSGTVVKLEVAVGAKVEKGQPVLILEAMKMNTTVTAPNPGTIASIAVTPGTSVAEGQVLMSIG